MAKIKSLFKFDDTVYDDDWKWIYFKNEKTDYRIHKDGRVSTTNFNNTGEPGFRKVEINTHGYKYVGLHWKGSTYNALIHRLVALAFIPVVKNKPFVNHIDGNKMNNDIGNLEWVTAKENIRHACETGLIKVGEKSTSSKYSENIVRKICNEIVKNKLSMIEISKKYKVNYTFVTDIRYKRIWHHVTKEYDFSHYNKITRAPKYGVYSNTKLTNEDVIGICELISEGESTLKNIAKKYNTTYKTVQYIYNRTTWTHISNDYDFSKYIKSNERK